MKVAFLEEERRKRRVFFLFFSLFRSIGKELPQVLSLEKLECSPTWLEKSFARPFSLDFVYVAKNGSFCANIPKKINSLYFMFLFRHTKTWKPFCVKYFGVLSFSLLLWGREEEPILYITKNTISKLQKEKVTFDES